MIRLGLRETLQLLQAHGPGEARMAGQAFAADPSDENSRRLTALRERELHDGPIGGIEF